MTDVDPFDVLGFPDSEPHVATPEQIESMRSVVAEWRQGNAIECPFIDTSAFEIHSPSLRPMGIRTNVSEIRELTEAHLRQRLLDAARDDAARFGW
jgi:hypothetical protein